MWRLLDTPAARAYCFADIRKKRVMAMTAQPSSKYPRLSLSESIDRVRTNYNSLGSRRRRAWGFQARGKRAVKDRIHGSSPDMGLRRSFALSAVGTLFLASFGVQDRSRVLLGHYSMMRDVQATIEARSLTAEGFGLKSASLPSQPPGIEPRLGTYRSQSGAETAKMTENVLLYLRKRAPIRTRRMAEFTQEPNFPSEVHACVDPSKADEPCVAPFGELDHLAMADATQASQGWSFIVLAHRNADAGVFYLASSDGLIKAVSIDKRKEGYELLDVKSLSVLGDFQAQLRFWNRKYLDCSACH